MKNIEEIEANEGNFTQVTDIKGSSVKSPKSKQISPPQEKKILVSDEA